MKHFYVSTSNIEGLGLRASGRIKRGSIVCRIKGALKFKVNKNKKDALANPDWVGIAKNQWIDPEKPYKFLNHSCNPNTGIKGKVTLVAIRDIKPEEEITIDYAIIEGDPRWEMRCHCKSKDCRKIIRSVHHLPPKQFKKYLPFISSHFRDLYSKEASASRAGMVS